MNRRILQLLAILSLLAFNTIAFAAQYDFKGRTYKLSPFTDKEPRPVFNSNSYEKSNLPIQMDLKDLQTPPKDQSNRGSCAHFAATALLEGIIKEKINEDVNISEEYLIYYTKAVLHNFSRSEGSSALNNLLAYRDGLLLEKDAPYQPSWFDKNLPCEKYESNSGSAPVYCYSHHSPSEEILERKIKDYDLEIDRLNEFGNNYSAQIMDSIAQNNSPVIVSLPVHHTGWDSSTGYSYYDEKLRKECQEDKDLCGGHAILITGFDLEKKILMFKNSWGADWGDSGYGTMPFEYVDRYSVRSPVTATIDSTISLPSDHNSPAMIEFTDINLNLDLEYIDEATQEKQVYVTLNSSVTYQKNNIVYMSAFIGYQANLEEPVGNDNFTMLQAREEFQKEYGYLIAGRFFHFLDSDTFIFDSNNPSEMKIPYKLIRDEDQQSKNLYLRVSAYGHGDLGWLTQYRKYVPIEI